ncbi:MAG: class I SAM-dependent methyltransferase [Deltaproteobacteria bacterium]|nr:class I SAM-dependent methyltransferase [Deltaproteobacteria bacterium]
MANLIVCCFPGDEIALFGNAVLGKNDEQWKALLVCPDPLAGQSYEQAAGAWRTSCVELGVEPLKSLNLPFLPTKQYDWGELSGLIRPFLKSCDKVYVPDLEDVSFFRRMVSFSAARHATSVWAEAVSGVGDAIHILDRNQINRLFGIANQHYALRLREKRLVTQDFRSVRQYRCLSGETALRFSHQWLSTNTPDIMDDDPWDIGNSVFEQERHRLELAALQQLEWNTLVEIGGCVGAFTHRLVEAFPGKDICVYEPNAHFAATLARRLGQRVRVVHGGVGNLTESFDVVFASSVLYYLKRFPLSLLDSANRYFVTSHIRWYHEEIVGPVFLAAGWNAVYEHELLPAIEDFCCIPILREGACIVAHERPHAA